MRFNGMTVFSLFSALLGVGLLATVALATEGRTQLRRCVPQPPDEQKLEAAFAEYLKRHNPPPYRYEGGELTRLDLERWTNLREFREAQPECCSIAYEDPERFKAPAVKKRLGEDFGGFAFIKVHYLFDHDPQLSMTEYNSYAVSSCGDVVQDMTLD